MRAESPSPANARALDRALVDRMIAGDEKALDEFTQTMIPRLYRFALRRLDGNSDLTKDIVQTTLCKVIQKLDSFRGDAALLTWLCSCCRNEIAMHFRRAGSRPEEVELDDVLVESRSDGDAGRQHDSLLQKEAAGLVHEALDQLPERYGTVLHLKYLEDLSVKQIAWRLQLSEKATESLLTRARTAFRTTYSSLAGEPSEETPSPAPALEAAWSPS